MSNQLPDIDETEKKKLVKAASLLIHSKTLPTIKAYMIVAFVENAKLTAEVNRLRAELQLEPVIGYAPRMG